MLGYDVYSYVYTLVRYKAPDAHAHVCQWIVEM
jgi:hypothetical protein